MRKLLLLGLAGCWSSSPAPARKPAPESAAGSAGGASYGGASYGGLAVLIGRGSGAGSGIRAGFGDPCGVPAGDVGGIGTAGGGSTGYGPGGGPGGGLGGSGTRTGLGGGPPGGGGPGYGPRGGPVGGTATGTGSGGGDVPTVSLGAPSGPSDGLDKAIIRRYIRRNISRIQHCYEQELDHDPALAGTVMVRFSIGGDGKVTQSTGSGLPPVDACVAAVIATVEFPKPQGGGVVAVNYPFIFQSAQDTPAP